MLAKFADDKLKGDLAENYFVKWVNSLGCQAIKTPDNEQVKEYHDYTVIKPDKSVIYAEIKADYRAIKTGNLFIEYETTATDNGIVKSIKSWGTKQLKDLYIFYYIMDEKIPARVLMFKSKDILDSIENWKTRFKSRSVKSIGLYKSELESKGFIIPEKYIKSLAVTLSCSLIS
jgi:hypothetical protein